METIVTRNILVAMTLRKAVNIFPKEKKKKPTL